MKRGREGEEEGEAKRLRTSPELEQAMRNAKWNAGRMQMTFRYIVDQLGGVFLDNLQPRDLLELELTTKDSIENDAALRNSAWRRMYINTHSPNEEDLTYLHRHIQATNDRGWKNLFLWSEYVAALFESVGQARGDLKQMGAWQVAVKFRQGPTAYNARIHNGMTKHERRNNIYSESFFAAPRLYHSRAKAASGWILSLAARHFLARPKAADGEDSVVSVTLTGSALTYRTNVNPLASPQPLRGFLPIFDSTHAMEPDQRVVYRAPPEVCAEVGRAEKRQIDLVRRYRQLLRELEESYSIKMPPEEMETLRKTKKGMSPIGAKDRGGRIAMLQPLNNSETLQLFDANSGYIPSADWGVTHGLRRHGRVNYHFLFSPLQFLHHERFDFRNDAQRFLQWYLYLEGVYDAPGRFEAKRAQLEPTVTQLANAVREAVEARLPDRLKLPLADLFAPPSYWDMGAAERARSFAVSALLLLSAENLLWMRHRRDANVPLLRLDYALRLARATTAPAAEGHAPSKKDLTDYQQVLDDALVSALLSRPPVDTEGMFILVGENACIQCGTEDAQYQCSSCEAAVYCSEKCQREHWSAADGHAVACRAFSRQ